MKYAAMRDPRERHAALAGSPLALTIASTISRSLGRDLEHVARRCASTFCLTSRVACSAAPLAIVAAREPPVPISAERRELRVAVDDADVVERDAELRRRDLRERRLVALAVRRLGRDDRQVPVGLEPCDRALVAAGAMPAAAKKSGGPGAGSM